VREQGAVILRTSDRLLPTSHLAGAVYCKTREKKVTAESALTGANLWWYKQRLRWCWNQTPGQVAKITSATPRCAGTTYGITIWGYWWEFVGHIDCDWSGGVGSGGVTRYRQGHLRYCPQPTGCIQNKFPWVWVKGYVGGTSQAGGGGT
jgi:hypothetical protein